jgi:hypothetical protein
MSTVHSRKPDLYHYSRFIVCTYFHHLPITLYVIICFLLHLFFESLFLKLIAFSAVQFAWKARTKVRYSFEKLASMKCFQHA